MRTSLDGILRTAVRAYLRFGCARLGCGNSSGVVLRLVSVWGGTGASAIFALSASSPTAGARPEAPLPHTF